MRILLLPLLLFISCEPLPQRTVASYHGAEVEADQLLCSESSLKLVCENELEETKEFKKRCLDQNRSILVCDCDEYLCVTSKEEELIPVPET